MLTDFFNVIILMGALQGFIISSLLFFSRKNCTANRLLAAFIFFSALACFNLSISGQKWTTTGQLITLVMAVVPMVIIMPLGPLLLFYTRATLNSESGITKKERVHFATVIIDLFPQLFALFFIIAVLSGLLKNSSINAGLVIDTYNVYADIPRWLSLTVYLVLSMRYTAAFSKTAAAGNLSGHLKWLKQLSTALIIFQSIWLLYLIPYVIPAYGDRLLDLVNWYPIYVPLVILIYWLGIKGFLIMQAQPSAVKKAAPVLPDAESTKIICILKEAMEQDGLYLNPALNLNLLAQHTALTPKIVSAVLNQHEHKNFNDFVNEYRVNAFKQKVCAAELRHLTIAGIAADCGFNSQATFQRIFKQFTGLSPTEYKAQAAKEYSNPDLSINRF
jgi:AraC-like DNA-binding protein